MNLGRLLAAGKSFVGGNDHLGRYRLNKRFALPKFVTPRNPFAPPPKPDAPLPRQPLAKPTGTNQAGGASAKAGVGATSKRQPFLTVGRRAVRWVGEWKQKLNPLPRLTGRRGPARSALPQFGKTPVQPELSLDRVRVVRNDLSDADFEVVMKKTPGIKSSAGPLVSPVGLTPSASAWDRLATRFFGAPPT